MPWMPGATKLPLPENSTEPICVKTQLIFHSAVGHGSVFDYFSKTSVLVESHFWVATDGTIEQYMDTDRQADANFKANARAISVESADNGDPDHYPWTAAQLASFAEIARWVHKVHNIPLRKVTAWDGPGLGYHSLYPMVWTNVKGKTCPGAARIKQFPALLASLVDAPTVIPPIGFHERIIHLLPTLSQGANGRDVKRLQALLNVFALGVSEDGDFGPGTERAVRAFQGRYGVPIDGHCGPLTWTALLDK